ncbi:MAG TPA: penicillin-binding protein 1C, partial [Hyphomicrobiaceae bacterium]|nr:penicillin-binding protein 1C [Hyphomicrobiaceae bacterium]
PTRFGTYAPRNFDDAFQGTVTIREALGRSLNIPAVKVLDAIGPGRLIGRLRRAGFSAVLPDDARPSLPIALGGVGMTLCDLAGIYTALGRGGDPIQLTHLRRQISPPMQSAKLKLLLEPVAAYYVTRILKDAPPPPNARAGQIAYKTGTSYGHRDAWAVGYDGKHTIAVWVGRPDATSTPGLMGRTAAAPILFDAFQRLSVRRARFAAAPAGALIRTGSELPEPLKRFEKRQDRVAAGLFLDPPVRISFPPDRSELEPASPDEPIILKAAGGVLPLTWLADGTPIGRTGHDRQIEWPGSGRGFVNFSVIDAKGRVDRVTVRVHGR